MVRWTGMGWLGLVPIVPGFALTLKLLAMVDASMPVRVVLFGPIFVALGILGTAPLGWWLNSTGTPQGRLWHDGHTLYDLPLQYTGVVYAIPSAIFVSLGLGRGWHPVAGWAFFAVSAFGLIMLIIRLKDRSDRRRRASFAPAPFWSTGPATPRPTGPVIDGESRPR